MITKTRSREKNLLTHLKFLLRGLNSKLNFKFHLPNIRYKLVKN